MPDINKDDFASILAANPHYLASLQRSCDLATFKATYNVSRASALRCPVCPGQYGGSLWVGDDPTQFTCRKCLLSFHIVCHQIANIPLLDAVRQAKKGQRLPPRGDDTNNFQEDQHEAMP